LIKASKAGLLVIVLLLGLLVDATYFKLKAQRELRSEVSANAVLQGMVAKANSDRARCLAQLRVQQGAR
jgi:hypothetical protein